MELQSPPDSLKKVRYLQKQRVLGVGLLETQRLLLPSATIFVINDRAHEDVTRQLLIACKQMSLTHFVLPKFAKGELSKFFKVRNLTSFAIDFEKVPQYRDKLL
jgi:hypothetical protein